MWRSSSSRKAERDNPARAARAFNSRCRASGTRRNKMVFGICASRTTEPARLEAQHTMRVQHPHGNFRTGTQVAPPISRRPCLLLHCRLTTRAFRPDARPRSSKAFEYGGRTNRIGSRGNRGPRAPKKCFYVNGLYPHPPRNHLDKIPPCSEMTPSASYATAVSSCAPLASVNCSSMDQ